MIRTLLSFCALFGGLLLVSKMLHESSHPQPPAAMPAPARIDFPIEQVELETKPSRKAPQAFPVGQHAAASGVVHRDDQVRLVAYTDESLEAVLDALRADFSLSGDPSQEDSEAGGDEPAATGTKAKEKPKSGRVATQKSEPSGDIAPPEPPAAPLPPELVELRGKIRECLAWYYFRPENVATRSPWGVMHAMIAYGVDTQVISNNQRVNAIGYLCYNGTCNGQRLFYTQNGQIQTQIGPGVQGHAGQFLAMLAQSRVKKDFPMQIDGYQFTVADLIEHEKLTCRPRTELTFKLIALTHYLKSDEKWRSNDGQEWDIPRLIKEELAQPINGAACGGTHRLTGFSYAVRKREQRGEPIEGQWKRAKTYIEDFHDYTFKLQNDDGSFSTEWFVMRADSPDPARRLQTTGHIVEWLAYSLAKDELTDPRMVKSVEYLTDLLLERKYDRWSIGPLGHGLHALAIYDERVFGGQPGQRATELAEVRRKAMER
jgi:hypothetical protein